MATDDPGSRDRIRAAHGGMTRSGPNTSPSTSGSRRLPPTVSMSSGTYGTASKTGAPLGSPLSRSPQGFPVAGLAQMRSRNSASRTAGGHRATTAACTGYGIEHVVASATPPAGGSQGTGVDLSAGGAVPVTLQTSRSESVVVRLRIVLSKHGKIRFVASRRGSDLERALRRIQPPRRLQRGVHLARSSRSASRFPPAMSPGGVPRCRS